MNYLKAHGVAMTYKVNHLCKHFGVSRGTVYNWIRNGVINKPDIQTGGTTLWLSLPVKSNQTTNPSA